MVFSFFEQMTKNDSALWILVTFNKKTRLHKKWSSVHLFCHHTRVSTVLGNSAFKILRIALIQQEFCDELKILKRFKSEINIFIAK